MACQFHPEKSGDKGIGIFKNFLEGNTAEKPGVPPPPPTTDVGLAKRVIACLDVRSNDNGDLVAGLHSLPGVRLVTWIIIPAVINWCFGCHSQVAECLHGPYRLSSTGCVLAVTPGC
jgi:hypothetical protein